MFRRAILSKNRLGQTKYGVEKSPDVLKKYLNPNTIVHSVNQGIDIFDHLNQLYLQNAFMRRERVLNIGGDHSMTIATGAHSLNTYKNMKFVWIDAHPDINTYKTSNSKNYHGMPLGYLSGLCNHPNLTFVQKRLPLKNILYIGIRDLDQHEAVIIKEKKISYITPEQCRNVNKVLKKIGDFIGNDPVHLSFDVDSVDPIDVECTGTPVKEGLSKETAKIIVNEILTSYDVRNMDITELNLQCSNKYGQKKSLDNILYICESVFK